MKRVGTSYSTITRLIGVPKSTLGNAIARYEKTGGVKSTTRPGRPPKTTERGNRQLLITSRQQREITYIQLRQNFAVDISIRCHDILGIGCGCMCVVMVAREVGKIPWVSVT